jgi:F0F1-type ATP synthase alpha subunit
MLKQKQFKMFSEANTIFSLFLGTNGYYDEVPVGEVLHLEQKVSALVLNSDVLSILQESIEEHETFDAEGMAYIVERYI